MNVRLIALVIERKVDSGKVICNSFLSFVFLTRLCLAEVKLLG
jgi:hypothetical protein